MDGHRGRGAVALAAPAGNDPYCRKARRHGSGKEESADKPGSVGGQSFIWDTRHRVPQAAYPGTVRATP